MSEFSALGLHPAILQSISELGFTTPTPIQAKIIPFMLQTPGDVIGLAQTGTGKTAAFGLPIIHTIQPDMRKTQALILSPTRELAVQISKDITTYSTKMASLSVLAVYGGAPIDKQIRAIKSGVQIIVATPGRMLDLINRRVVDFSNIKFLVLDEADEMLNMGFKDELDAILEVVPDQRITMLFSATMPPEVSRIAKNYMNNPIEISVGKKNAGNASIRHIIHLVHEKDRYEVVKRIADSNPSIYGIIFCRTRIETQQIAEKLMKDGYPAESLHGDLSQSQRDYVMGKFRDKHIRLLVATDVAARGLDVNSLTHVVNYNLPDDMEVYTHRSGRTGRAGKTGTCVSIINTREKGKVHQIQKGLQAPIEILPVPTGYDICENQLHALIDKIHTVEIQEDKIAPFMADIQEKLEHIDRDILLKKVLSLEFNRFFDYYSKMADLNVPEFGGDRSRNRDGGRPERSDRPDAPRRERGGNEPGFTRLFINLGKLDGITPKLLMGVINEATRQRGIEIGRIDLGKTFSHFDVDEKFAQKIVDDFKGAEYNNRAVNVEIAREKTDRPADFQRKERSDRPDRSERSFRGDRNFRGERNDRGGKGEKESFGGYPKKRRERTFSDR